MNLYLMRAGCIAATGAPVPVYLIETDDGRRILVDTGYPRERAGAYRDNPREPVRLDAADTVDRQLAALGLGPGDIDIVVCSHLDPDHAGNHDLFASAEFVIQEEQYRLGRSGTVPRVEFGRARWDRPELRYRLVRGDTCLLPGIELIESGGHIAGHQSVLLRPGGAPPVLLAVDAIPTTEALDPDTRPIYPLDLDAARVRETTRKLVALADRMGARIVCGHDEKQWSALPAAPHRFV